jgi:hypothetical protein
VHRLFDELFNNGNPSAANEMISADYVAHIPFRASPPKSRVRSTHSDVMYCFRRQLCVRRISG